MAEPSPDSSPENAAVRALEEEIHVLEQRLRNGEEILRTKKEAGGDHELLAYWESRWIKLLRQYELVCDRLERHMSVRRQASNAPPSPPQPPVQPPASAEHSKVANR